MFIWVLLAIVVVVLLVGVGLFNKIVTLENRIKNAWGQIDVQLKRRNDLIPNLVETVKGYATHEREVLTNVIAARNQSMSATTVQEQAAAERNMTGALGRLFAVAEAYPDLKANTNFTALQQELSETEDKIAYSRQFYNDAVYQFNTTIQTVPGIFIAGPMGKSEKPMLEIPESERAVPKVAFDNAPATEHPSS